MQHSYKKERTSADKVEGPHQPLLGADDPGRSLPALKITYKDPAQLKPRARNPRTHTQKQIQQIAASIKEFGFISPILADGAGGIIAGHGRAEAAKLIGMSDVPTVHVDHLTPAQVRAYVIADNKLAENAGWDRELLALALSTFLILPIFERRRVCFSLGSGLTT